MSGRESQTVIFRDATNPDFLDPREYFRDKAGTPRKSFGQHFLAQPRTAAKIVREAHIKPADVVVEIGPGLGALTRFILEGPAAELHLVELDRDLAEYLRERVKGLHLPVHVHRRDVLDFEFERLSKDSGRPLVVLGNLPYNISSPLLFRLLRQASFLDRAVFMVQKEVGRRWAAPPGGKDYGVLSVLLSLYARVEVLFEVGPKQFHPPPRVDSVVLRLDFNRPFPDELPPFEDLRAVANTAFQQRRKTLRNSLKSLPGVNRGLVLEEAFAAAGIDSGRRAETLAGEELVRLTRALAPWLRPPAEHRSSGG